jgi:predicted MFS family arabinose efflux permease
MTLIFQLFWLLVYIAYDVEHLYLARFLGGLTGGGMIRTIPLFICEISENQ